MIALITLTNCKDRPGQKETIRDRSNHRSSTKNKDIDDDISENVMALKYYKISVMTDTSIQQWIYIVFAKKMCDSQWDVKSGM